ncbi:MAG: shikimate kinase [Acidobacteriota bacterium]
MNKRSTKTVSASPRVRTSSPERLGTSAPEAVFLVGFMGAGKSSVGAALGRRLNWIFEDLDDRIERRERRTVAQIFRESGEPAFRRAERSALHDVLEGIHNQARVVALGGGAFVQSGNAELLKSSGVPIIFLDAPVEELWERCCRQANEAAAERPLLRSLEQFRELHEQRRANYSEASLTIETGGRTVDEIADEIAAKLGLKMLEHRSPQGDVE